MQESSELKVICLPKIVDSDNCPVMAIKQMIYITKLCLNDPLFVVSNHYWF